MKLHELTYTEGSRKDRKRIGRGHGSGQGKTAGKGHKGQNARSGGGVRIGFEGGQTPLFRRLPKRGFTNINRKVEDGTIVTAELLLETGVIKKLHSGVKVLGQGQLEKKLTVKAAKFSKTAEEQIAAQGGSIEVV